MIAIVNYGSGNIDALCTIYKKLGVPFLVASSPAELDRADRILLPGVGAYDQAMTDLERSGLRYALDLAVGTWRKPLLGICVGMQLLGYSSEEGVCRGLGWIPGAVRKFDHRLFKHATRLPHMGWNTVDFPRDAQLFAGIDPGSEFYFLHSYHLWCEDPADQLASTNYGTTFTSAVRRENVFGVQFHPEKSHQVGITLLHNFATGNLQPPL
jgi:glutamine amidotransferase